MNNIGKAPKPENPVMLDRVLGQIQDALVAKLGWLDHAFGKVQKLVTSRDAKSYYYPAVYVGNGEYLNVLPGQGLGNRTFFIASDPQDMNFHQLRLSTLKCPVSLVLWYDLSTIFEDQKDRNTEEIKMQMVDCLEKMTMPNGSTFTCNSIYEEAENIFRPFSVREIDTQFMMQPYAGMRIDMTVIYQKDCL